MPELQEFRLTFGLRYGDEPHPSFPAANPKGWVAVMAEDYEAARALVVERIGNAWAFLYPVDKFQASYHPAGETARWSRAETSPESLPITTASEPDLGWRQGRHQAQNVYEDGQYVGVMFAPRTAARVVDAMNGRLRLYCWPCKDVHTIELADVERIVYALGAAELVSYQSGFDDGGPLNEPTRLPDDPPTCHLVTLRHAADIEVFAEHVEQGVACREAQALGVRS